MLAHMKVHGSLFMSLTHGTPESVTPPLAPMVTESEVQGRCGHLPVYDGHQVNYPQPRPEYEVARTENIEENNRDRGHVAPPSVSEVG